MAEKRQDKRRRQSPRTQEIRRTLGVERIEPTEEDWARATAMAEGMEQDLRSGRARFSAQADPRVVLDRPTPVGVDTPFAPWTPPNPGPDFNPMNLESFIAQRIRPDSGALVPRRPLGFFMPDEIVTGTPTSRDEAQGFRFDENGAPIYPPLPEELVAPLDGWPWFMGSR